MAAVWGLLRRKAHPVQVGGLSSNRRVGVRRIPGQLLESSTALLTCAAAAIAVLAIGVTGDGLIFLATLAAYTAGRQVVFPLRDLPRATSHGRQVMLMSSLLATVAATAVQIAR